MAGWGTLRYVAIEVLELAFRDDLRKLDHTYHHDLESFFYVFLDICINYGRPRSKPDPLVDWYIGRYKTIADVKSGQMVKKRFENSFLANFVPAFDNLKNLASTLRDALFHQGDLYTRTSQVPSPLYKRMIKAFDDTIEQLICRPAADQPLFPECIFGKLLSKATSFGHLDSTSRPSPPRKRRASVELEKMSKRAKGDEADNNKSGADALGHNGSQIPFKNRILSCLAINPAGRALHTFQSVSELLRAFRDAIKAHRSLFLDGKILHRDVSKNNIIITDPHEAGGFSGTLIDLDLAVRVDDQGKNEQSGAQKMMGTLKYMAIEVVELAFRDDLRKLDHTYRHDLESFFYVFLDICINYGWPSGRRRGADPLQDWYVGKYKEMAEAKAGDMSRRYFESNIVDEFSPTFGGVKGLARTLRSVLFGEGELNTGTPEEAGPLYAEIIKSFDVAIEKL